MNKFIKIIGNVLTVFAIVFVIWKLASQSVDYTVLFNRRTVLPLIVIIVVQTGIVISNCLPWTALVSSISNSKIGFQQTCLVYLKSNLMKYVPGNVFQYIGRNELAARYNVSHAEVASATIIDVALNLISGFIISFLFFHNYMISVLVHSHISLILSVLLTVSFISLIVFVLVKRKWVKSVVKSYSYIFTKRNLVRIFECLAYYLLALFAGGILFALVMYWLLGEPFEFNESLVLISAYTLSWVVGFITPGAPAGIGVKEAVMISVVPAAVASSSAITLAMVVIRILMTIADVLAFAIGALFTHFLKTDFS